jgi:hypothetical protein
MSLPHISMRQALLEMSFGLLDPIDSDKGYLYVERAADEIIRKHIVAKILSGDGPGRVIITGLPGMGKTSAMHYWAGRIDRDHPSIDVVIVPRFPDIAKFALVGYFFVRLAAALEKRIEEPKRGNGVPHELEYTPVDKGRLHDFLDEPRSADKNPLASLNLFRKIEYHLPKPTVLFVDQCEGPNDQYNNLRPDFFKELIPRLTEDVQIYKNLSLVFFGYPSFEKAFKGRHDKQRFIHSTLMDFEERHTKELILKRLYPRREWQPDLAPFLEDIRRGEAIPDNLYLPFSKEMAEFLHRNVLLDEGRLDLDSKSRSLRDILDIAYKALKLSAETNRSYLTMEILKTAQETSLVTQIQLWEQRIFNLEVGQRYILDLIAKGGAMSINEVQAALMDGYEIEISYSTTRRLIVGREYAGGSPGLSEDGTSGDALLFAEGRQPVRYRLADKQIKTLFYQNLRDFKPN